MKAESLRPSESAMACMARYSSPVSSVTTRMLCSAMPAAPKEKPTADPCAAHKEGGGQPRRTKASTVCRASVAVGWKNHSSPLRFGCFGDCGVCELWVAQNFVLDELHPWQRNFPPSAPHGDRVLVGHADAFRKRTDATGELDGLVKIVHGDILT